MTVLELEIGFLAMERKDSRQVRIMRSWLRGVIKEFSTQVLPFTGSTAILCALMHVPNWRSSRDAMIAATARVHGYTVVPRNTDSFTGCGVQLLNPWLSP